MPRRSFLLVDACAALAWAALVVSVGSWLDAALYSGPLPLQPGM
jgi:membrane protein DedA with SNARE-associated domain